MADHVLRMSRRSARCATGALIAVGVLTLAACSPQQVQVRDLVNISRAQAGLKPLNMDPPLAGKAQAWADHLATTGTLAHSALAEGVPDTWIRIGENVGRGPSIPAIHDGYMASPAHRTNILDTGFTNIGTGYAQGPCAPGSTQVCQYTVQVFAQYR